MANLVDYVKTVWENGKTALSAARMNNMEQGISNCASQINRLGDSVSRKMDKSSFEGGRITFAWQFGDGLITGLVIKVDGQQVIFIRNNTNING